MLSRGCVPRQRRRHGVAGRVCSRCKNWASRKCWWRMAGTTARRTWSGAWNRTSSRISRAAGNATTKALEDRLNAVSECPADADAVTAMKYRLQTAVGKAIYSKRKAGGNGVRGDQGGAGIPALSSARVTRRRGRMESGVHGVESEAAVCLGVLQDDWDTWIPVPAEQKCCRRGRRRLSGEHFQSYDHVAGPQSFSGSVDRVFLIPAKLIPTDS